MKYRRIMKLLTGGLVCTWMGIFVVPGSFFLLALGAMMWGFASIEMTDPWN